MREIILKGHKTQFKKQKTFSSLNTFNTFMIGQVFFSEFFQAEAKLRIDVIWQPL